MNVMDPELRRANSEVSWCWTHPLHDDESCAKSGLATPRHRSAQRETDKNGIGCPLGGRCAMNGDAPKPEKAERVPSRLSRVAVRAMSLALRNLWSAAARARRDCCR